MLSTAEESQAHLLRRIATQDRQALAEFYDQTVTLLFSLAVRILGDPNEAEEVIQDVFVQIWQKAAAFNPLAGTPVQWAVSIARNRAIDRLRARQRRSRLLTEFQEQALEPTTADPPAQAALADDETAAVRAAVRSLPSEQRQAIEMAFFGGLTHVEVADALQQPVGTIKARIRRGMLKLRESLQAYV